MLLGNFGGVGRWSNRARRGPKLSIVEYSLYGSVFPEIFHDLRALDWISPPFFPSLGRFSFRHADRKQRWHLKITEQKHNLNRTLLALETYTLQS
jgi:hypothetical protein